MVGCGSWGHDGENGGLKLRGVIPWVHNKHFSDFDPPHIDQCSTERGIVYFSLVDSLCSVFLRHQLQYLLNLSLSGVLVLFLLVK